MIRGMTANDANRTPIDQALDLFVYLPVGVVSELSRSIPRFIERGRHELHADAPAGDPAEEAESPLGRFDPVRRLDRAQAHAFGTLRALGVLPREEHAAPIEAPAPRPTAAAAVIERSAGDAAPAAARPANPANGAVDAPALDPDALAIPGYDSLSASQVMPRLESLSGDELELVRRYEHASRGRKTILNKIAQLQAG
jgi:hypothetical protein